MRLLRAGIIVLAFILIPDLSTVSLFACKLGDGYLRPSNFDLVKQTEVILLAEAISFNKKAAVDVNTPHPAFIFKILEVMKGDFAQDFLTEQGSDTYLGKSDEYNFRHVRQSAGACNADNYEIGRKFLLFVNKVEGKWKISGPPHSRINEEVNNNDSPWITAVRHYVNISSLNNYEAEKAALRALRENARASRDVKEYPYGLVRDIDNFFESPYPSKSYQDLIDIYNNNASDVRRDVLWAFAYGKHQAAKHFILRSVLSGRWDEYIAPISEYMRRTKDRAFINTLSLKYLETQSRVDRWPIMDALVEIADKRDSSFMLAALKSADKEEAREIAAWFVRHPVGEATKIIRGLVNSDYREHYELAFSLAGLGDNGVLTWAKGIINTWNEDRWIGYYIIAHSPLNEADRLAKAIIRENNPEDLIHLIQGYSKSSNPNRLERLRDVIDLENKDSQVDYWLRRTLKEMTKDSDDGAWYYIM